ncbi:nucleoside phosphorylase domain-containing protein [Penicillium canescens]|uniref:Nucleoside phosphorylase domain-containing protein n=1 Tax=Penicillium canescens TaxID=5083 RepID=A0AAD6N8G8_PENCN|nr:nucleoside phosphorylase domain-containing protein [Penicillium canescens]KAJ6041445.1 nucleoside phosphorylase domain-containing protein [Penicillium canescens]KAJ6050557.1 nucleoside phosphorylase domain-containing protein [Penicillium canescens]KAJ6065778.1 nucleoside phosphorylase domain-containing protein [Penicillium canescens]
MSLENSVAAINASLCSSPGGRIFPITGTSEQSYDDYLGLTGQSALISFQDVSENSSNPGDTEVVPPTEASLNPQSSTDLADSRIASDGQEDQLTPLEMQILEKQIEQDLDPDSGMTAAEVWEDTRSISRKAKRLALEALSLRETQVAASWGTSARFTHEDYTVGWVCTRPLEYAVAEGMLDEQHSALPQVENDTNTYTLGGMQRHNVVLLCIPAGAMETGVANTAVSGMLRSFPNIRIRLLVGVAGGVPNHQIDIRIGDVMVGSPVSSSGGVMLLKGSGESFAETGTLETPPRELGNALATLQARHIRRRNEIQRHIEEMLEANPAMRLPFSFPDPEGDLLLPPYYEHHNKGMPNCLECDPPQVIPRPKHRGRPAVFYGPIGWTSSVINSGLALDAVSRQRVIYCIEMETMGLINLFPCIVIRGIWNYSDSHRNKAWQ